jgi:hypothetical protein
MSKTPSVEFTDASKKIVMFDGFKEDKSKELKRDSELWCQLNAV